MREFAFFTVTYDPSLFVYLTILNETRLTARKIVDNYF